MAIQRSLNLSLMHSRDDPASSDSAASCVDPSVPPTDSAFATLLLGVETKVQRGYFYSALVLGRALRQLNLTQPYQDQGSRPIFVVMVLGSVSDGDAALLDREGIRLVRVRELGAPPPQSPMAPEFWIVANKVWLWKLTEYRKIVFLDADMMPMSRNLGLFHRANEGGANDPLLEVRSGFWSPINTGLLVLKPSCRVFRRFAGLIRKGDWDPHDGWENAGPFPFWRQVVGRDDVPSSVLASTEQAGGDAPLLSNWQFYCSSSDQGLVHHVFNIRREETCAAERARWRGENCVVVHGRASFNRYLIHFLSDQKPWLVPLTEIATVAKRHRKGAIKWYVLFDELNVPRPNGKPGDPPLRAAELPHLLKPLHTGLRQVRLKMKPGEDRTVFVALPQASAD